MKRKNSKPAEPNGKSKKKKVEEVTSKLNFGNPESLFKSLLAPIIVSKFFKDNWEQNHIHIKRKDEAYYGELFSLDKLYEILDEEEITYETDINICKYVEGQKEMMNEEEDATSKEIKKKFEEENGTIQFHQPQRFVNVLWNMLENLERYFGCLFGANCYITPPGSQGLAPHCDDVEVFILQLSGEKAWKLYKPIDELSRNYSPDLEESKIGKPIAELNMKQGDLLYFPRGTIHQAATVGDKHSLHITLSTYQNHSLGDLLSNAVKHSIEEAIQSDVEFRRGLPINVLSYLGTGKRVSSYVKHIESNGEQKEAEPQTPDEDKRVVELKSKMGYLLHRLADHLDLHVAADSLTEDYLANRLPPYAPDNDDEDLKEENSPSLKSKIKVKHPDHVRLVIYSEDNSESDGYEDSFIEEEEMKEMEEARDKKENKGSSRRGRPQTRTNSGSNSSKSKPSKTTNGKSNSEGDDDDDMSDSSDEDEDSDEEEDGPHIAVLHSCSNDRSSHMIGEGREGGIRFPLHFATAVEHVLKNSDKFIEVKNLPKLDDAEREKLAISLWSDGLVEVQC